LTEKIDKKNRKKLQITLDFPELPRIKSDKVILDHKKLYLICFENFYSLWFTNTYGQFLLKITKNENYQNKPNMTLWSKITLSDIISTENNKSPEKSGEVRTAFWRTFIFCELDNGKKDADNSYFQFQSHAFQ
jgi:hypothetical protein